MDTTKLSEDFIDEIELIECQYGVDDSCEWKRDDENQKIVLFLKLSSLEVSFQEGESNNCQEKEFLSTIEDYYRFKKGKKKNRKKEEAEEEDVAITPLPQNQQLVILKIEFPFDYPKSSPLCVDLLKTMDEKAKLGKGNRLLKMIMKTFEQTKGETVIMNVIEVVKEYLTEVSNSSSEESHINKEEYDDKERKTSRVIKFDKNNKLRYIPRSEVILIDYLQKKKQIGWIIYDPQRYTPDMVKFLVTQQKKKQYTDFRIIVEDSQTEIHVHKCILAARTLFFREFFSKENPPDFIKVQGYDHDIVSAWVQFLYMLKLEIHGVKNIESLYRFSINYGLVSELKKFYHGKYSSFDTLYWKLLKKMKSQYHKLLTDAEFTDLTIICEIDTKVIQAHKVFTSYSSFVHKCLNSGMLEQIESKLIFDSLSYKGLMQVLEYLYTHKLNFINHETALELHIFSILFNLPKVGEKCRRIISELINEENVMQIIQLFYIYEDKLIQKECVELICKNYDFFEKEVKGLDDSCDFKWDIILRSVKKREEKIKRERKKIFRKKRNFIVNFQKRYPNKEINGINMKYLINIGNLNIK